MTVPYAVPVQPPAIRGEINLGDRIRSKISGWCGVVEAMTVWLNGCVRVQACPDRVDKDGAQGDSHNFDLLEVELLEKSVVEPMWPFVHPIASEVGYRIAQHRALPAPGGPAREARDFDPRRR